MATLPDVDLVSDVLLLSGVRGTLGSRVEAGGSWSVVLPGSPRPVMHAVTTGSAWLTIRGSQPRELTAGDVVLLSGGIRHVLGDAPDARAAVCPPSPTQEVRPGEVLRLGSLPSRTRVVTIHYEYDPAVRTQVFRHLPGVVHVGADVGAVCFDDAVRLLGRELANPQIATTAVLKSLVDIMLVQVLRAWLFTQPTEMRGTWLGMLGDPVVRQALELIHQDPARGWTTAALAAELAVSRATLSRRFPAAIGQSPAAYLTQWRLDLAAVQLRDTNDSIETVAAAIGFGSVPAFTRAFQRVRGQAPSRYRVEARESALRDEFEAVRDGGEVVRAAQPARTS